MERRIAAVHVAPDRVQEVFARVRARGTGPQGDRRKLRLIREQPARVRGVSGRDGVEEGEERTVIVHDGTIPTTTAAARQPKDFDDDPTFAAPSRI